MTPCPCGCGQPVKAGRTYARGACLQRTVSFETRQAWGRKGGRPPTPVESVVCAGCGDPFDRPTTGRASTKRFCSLPCARAALNRAPEFAAYRANRSQRGGAALRRRMLEDVEARVAGMTPATAYTAGYRAGYLRGRRWWEHKYRMLRRELSAKVPA